MQSACKRLQNQFIKQQNFKDVSFNIKRYKSVIGPVTPIYADTRDDFQHLHQNVLNNINISKVDDYEMVVKSRRNNFKDRWNQAKSIIRYKESKRLKSKNKDKKTPIEDYQVKRIAKAILDEVVIDEDLNVPYDFGYDHLIEREKAKSQENKQNDGFLEELKELMAKLDYIKEKDLISCHKYIIANKRKIDYQSQAKYIILDTVIMEILESKKKYWKKNQNIDKMLDRSKIIKDENNTKTAGEYQLSEFNDQKYEGLKESLLQGINQDHIDKVSSLLAVKDIEEEVNYEDELRFKKLGFIERRNKHALALEKTDPFFSSFSSDEDGKDQRARGDYYRFSVADQMSDPKDFKDSLILKKIKNRYYRKKFELFKYNKDHNAETLDILSNEKQDSNKKEQNSMLDSFDKDTEKASPWTTTDFFDKNELADGLNQLERRNEIDKRPPQFSDILEDVDMVYESLPVELRIIFDREGSFYRQRFGTQDINIRELLWKNFSTDLNRMVPFVAKFQEEVQKNNDGFMEPKVKSNKDQASIEEKHEEKKRLAKLSFEEQDDLGILTGPTPKDIMNEVMQEDTDFMDKDINPFKERTDDQLTPEQKILKEASEDKSIERTPDLEDAHMQDFSDGDDTPMTADEERKYKKSIKKLIYPVRDTPIERKIIAKSAPLQNEQTMSLTEEQKIEIELFKQTRVDPFYEHYLKDSLDFYSHKTGDLTRYMGKDLPFYVKDTDLISGDKIRLEKQQQYKYMIKERIKKSDSSEIIGVSRHKRARCWVVLDSNNGEGKVEVNNRKYIEYFSNPYCRAQVTQPLIYTENALRFNIKFFVHGGGLRGQLEACRLALSKALVIWDQKLEPRLRKLELLKQNRKRKERKKPGLYKARKKFIYKRR